MRVDAADVAPGQFGATGGGGDYSFPGNVGIGITNPTSRLHVSGLPVYATNADAMGAGLTPGAFFMSDGTVKVAYLKSAGDACDSSAECATGHCQNGFCCASGDCCTQQQDCNFVCCGQQMQKKQ